MKSRNEASELTAIPIGLDAMMEMQRPTLTAMAELNSKLYESIAAANKEWASFVNRRLKEDFALPQQLVECKNVQDLYRVYSQFFQNACQQYQAQVEHMTVLSRSIAENALQGPQSGAGRGPTH